MWPTLADDVYHARRYAMLAVPRPLFALDIDLLFLHTRAVCTTPAAGVGHTFLVVLYATFVILYAAFNLLAALKAETWYLRTAVT